MCVRTFLFISCTPVRDKKLKKWLSRSEGVRVGLEGGTTC